MGKRCLTVYDITGIQEFIFSSNKAKENIGASIYVQEFFDKILLQELKNMEAVETDWQNSTGLKIKSDASIRAEVIYIGGGNALVVFDNKETAINITKTLSRVLLDETQATLGLAVAYLETDLTNFEVDRKELFKMLNLNKNTFIQSTPLRGISISRECEDGLPTNGARAKKEKNIFISLASQNKRRKAETEIYFDDLLANCKDYEFPLDFDNLGRQKGESQIAVVHVDGNSMGHFIDDKLDHVTDYDEAVESIRDISKKIRDLYRETFQKMVTACQESLKDATVKKRICLHTTDDGRLQLPLRPIILNGDDVTFVCDGRIGIQMANFFLRQLAKTPLDLKSGKENMSACAGIAIVKSHFPFYRAYALAEDLCGSAKKKAKGLNRETPGSWMDYHIVYSGFQLHLERMRNAQYNVPGMDAVVGSDTEKFKSYNLLLRPFQVAGANQHELYDWNKMEKLFTGLRKWPRSRLKNLRNAFIVSEEDVKTLQVENSSRKYYLPKYNVDGKTLDSENIFHSNQTPYFEPLELLDFYIPEFKLDRQESE